MATMIVGALGVLLGLYLAALALLHVRNVGQGHR